MNLAFHERLKVSVGELRQRCLDVMETGLSESSYWQSVGYCRALKEVLDEADAIRKRIVE